MATKEQIEMILEKLEKSLPDEFFKKVDETQAGIGAVLRLLNKSNDAVTAGRISEVLNVSTARVAVLLKKMVAKGLITKEQLATDGRVTVVKLTEFGLQIISEMQAEVYSQTARIIDTVGEERILEFIAIADEIKSAFKEPNFDFLEIEQSDDALLLDETSN